jgi:dihydrofolate reductase
VEPQFEDPERPLAVWRPDRRPRTPDALSDPHGTSSGLSVRLGQKPSTGSGEVQPIGGTLIVMRPLRYSINVTLDGCCDHREMLADEELHRHATENIAQADALLFGRVTYEMMEAAWRPPARTGERPDWMEPWMQPFARTIDAAKKYVVSSTLDRVDWNAELLRGDLGKAVQQLKRESGKGLFVGGVKLPLALAELGLIDEYEFVVHPRLAGHGPTLFAGLPKHVDLKLVSRLEFGSGAVAMRYEPR